MRLAVLVFLFLLQQPVREAAMDFAPVEVDGDVLFRVRGFEARPATERASFIAGNITMLAADPAFRPETLHSEDRGNVTYILAGETTVMGLSDVDAQREGVQRPLMASALVDRIRRAIIDYRLARTQASLIRSATHVAAALAIALGLLALLLWLSRRGEVRLQRAFERRVDAMSAESRRILRVEGFWRSLSSAFSLGRFVVVVLVALFVLEYILTQFPWTRGAGVHLFKRVSGPLAAVAMDIVSAVPNVVVIAILIFVTRYVLSLARMYFDALEGGRIRIHNFEPQWAGLTHNLVRFLVIASAILIAYPYIPGSGSDAFKGVSILIGVLLSLGSTSAVSNVIAGYMIVFRRAFYVGDRVKIGQIHGCVTEMRMQVTHIRNAKNEEITIPNSLILGSEVINYSSPAREGKLILHTEVGIGYEVSCYQVEAMLLEAADRTPNLLKDPPPFVMQLELAQFSVTYEINAYSDRAEFMLLTYSDLRRNILDVFNENRVQIMTPSYEGDPETPKIAVGDHKSGWQGKRR